MRHVSVALRHGWKWTPMIVPGGRLLVRGRFVIVAESDGWLRGPEGLSGNALACARAYS